MRKYIDREKVEIRRWMKVAQMRSLMSKQVVNVNTGRVLGKIWDVSLDESGKVAFLTVKKKRQLFSQKEEPSFAVEWSEVVKWNDDVILVKCEQIPSAPAPEKNEDGILAAVRNIFPVALLVLSVLILLKSCIGP